MLTIKIVKLDPRNRDTSNPLETLKEFEGVTALTAALLYWDDNQLHKETGSTILVVDEFNEVPLRLCKQLFEDL